MYTVTDKPIAKIYSINSDGDLIDSLDFIGNDLEAIVFNKNDSTYWVSEESLIQIVKIDTEGKEVNRFDIDFFPNLRG